MTRGKSFHIFALEMDEHSRTYIAIDLKSFFASVECVERGLNPLTTNLVVADISRTEKTICLAITPSLKSYGLPGRARLFEVISKVNEINQHRLFRTHGRGFEGKSYHDPDLKSNPYLELDYVVAPPRMAYYIEYSSRIYNIYLKYIAPEDIHVYSIDEVFIDASTYLKCHAMSAHELTMTIIKDVLACTGITATAGIGSNMYLAKVAMDIVAKHIAADKDGVRIAELDEMSYREKLWSHRPLTDFWRVGKGIAQKLEQYGIYTMGDIARQSIVAEEVFYRCFGVNAELLIDHAWGWEPCTIADIKAYKPDSNSLSNGQVLKEPYDTQKARVVLKEMAEEAALRLLNYGLLTDQVSLYIGYDSSSLDRPDVKAEYKGDLGLDHYGRIVPKHAQGRARLSRKCNSTRLITEGLLEIFDRVVDPRLLIRRINISTNELVYESEWKVSEQSQLSEYDLFTDIEEEDSKKKTADELLSKERRMQEAILQIKKKYGKNALLKGHDFEDGATSIERNSQIGGHKA